MTARQSTPSEGDRRSVPGALLPLAAALVAVATVLALVAVAILPFLNPIWIGFEQDRAGATEWTGWEASQVRTVTNALLSDLVLGPPDFGVELDGRPVFDERERAHMRDVRVVFSWVLGLGVASAVLLALLWRGTRGARWLRRGVAVGGGLVASAVAVLGAIFAIAFDAAFEAFHQVFFPAGSYNFDPASARLVQLLPGQLWYETSLAFGGVLFLLALLAVVLGRRRPHHPGAPR